MKKGPPGFGLGPRKKGSAGTFLRGRSVGVRAPQTLVRGGRLRLGGAPRARTHVAPRARLGLLRGKVRLRLDQGLQRFAYGRSVDRTTRTGQRTEVEQRKRVGRVLELARRRRTDLRAQQLG